MDTKQKRKITMESTSISKKVLTKIGMVLFVVVGYISIASFSVRQEDDREQEILVEYPEGYRAWTHVKTYVVRPKNPAYTIIGGFNHVYANDKAMVGYQTGHFPDGAIIVSDVIEAAEDSLNTREGKRVHIDVMIKDSLKFTEPGGWRFETFDKDSKTLRLLTPASRLQCNNCHHARSNDMVFSEYRK